MRLSSTLTGNSPLTPKSLRGTNGQWRDSLLSENRHRSQGLETQREVASPGSEFSWHKIRKLVYVQGFSKHSIRKSSRTP